MVAAPVKKSYALIGAVCLAIVAAVSAYAYSTGSPVLPVAGTPAIAGVSTQAAGASASASLTPAAKAASLQAKAAAKKLFEKPLWNDLTAMQKRALEPLALEWDPLDGGHKRKWLQLSEKFSTMKPDEQARVQERMREWVKLTPEQRRQVRENFWRAKTITPDQRSAQWQQYQQLPEEQKKQLAADNTNKKQVANLPSVLPSKGKTTPNVTIVKPASRPTKPLAPTPNVISLVPQPVGSLIPVVTPLQAPAAATPLAPAAATAAPALAPGAVLPAAVPPPAAVIAAPPAAAGVK